MIRTAAFSLSLILTLMLALMLVGPGALHAEERVTGYQELTPELKAMQDDPFTNPGMLWVGEGERLWNSTTEGNGQSCQSCHGGVESMTGVAPRYPAFDEAQGKVSDLAGKIQQCQVEHQEREPSPRESRELLSLTAFVSRPSDGMPITPDNDPRLDAARKQGEELFHQRLGQLNLSCAQCHDDNKGQRLLGALLPEAHPTGYPQYRLEWENMGSLQRRFNNCLTGFRSQPFESGSQEYIALEAYLMERARGLPLEAPAIRP